LHQKKHCQKIIGQKLLVSFKLPRKIEKKCAKLQKRKLELIGFANEETNKFSVYQIFTGYLHFSLRAGLSDTVNARVYCNALQ
jgi:hypothetical protein